MARNYPDTHHIQWHQTYKLPSRTFTCGFCGVLTSVDEGYCLYNISSILCDYGIYPCSNCGFPTFFAPSGYQYPGESAGNPVKNVPDAINNLYEEARRCFSVNAFSAVAMLCRKLLMNIAHELGADVNKPFTFYVDYLELNHHISPKSKSWVDHIRKKGNEATHEIASTSKKDAVELLVFVEMILKTLYEYPTMVAPTP